MGACPITALSIVCFPETSVDISVLKEILRGAMDALIEAGTALVGGHSIKDNEVKFGLSITGTIHPDDILKNNTHTHNEVFISQNLLVLELLILQVEQEWLLKDKNNMLYLL